MTDRPSDPADHRTLQAIQAGIDEIKLSEDAQAVDLTTIRLTLEAHGETQETMVKLLRHHSELLARHGEAMAGMTSAMAGMTSAVLTMNNRLDAMWQRMEAIENRLSR